MLRALEGINELHAETGNPLSAARAAFWLGFRLMGMREFSSGNGWLARAERMIERAGCDCVEQGYLLLPEMCTGFHPGFSWIDLPIFERHEPRHLGGEVPSAPGLYFLGLRSPAIEPRAALRHP